jgi:hypothetical protein
MDQRIVLITLLIKLGVSAAISSVLARSRRFRVLLFHEERTISENLEMVLFIGAPYALGVVVRHTVKNFGILPRIEKLSGHFHHFSISRSIDGSGARLRNRLLTGRPRSSSSSSEWNLFCSRASEHSRTIPLRSRVPTGR